jgi:MFS family permease
MAEWFSWPGLAGPYAASAGFLALGAVVVSILLRPDPRELAKAVAEPVQAGTAADARRPLGEILADRGVRTAMFSMLLSQGVMSMLMVISSLHMKHHDHPLSAISLVMSSHMVGMYAFSMVTGRLADSWGRGPLIAVGALVLIGAGVGAMVAVAALPMALVLLFLGLGWNLCYVGGSTLLSDRLTQVERARVQGINDALLTGASAIGSLLSGLVFARVGYSAMGLVAGSVALIPLALGWRWSVGRVSNVGPQIEPAG